MRIWLDQKHLSLRCENIVSRGGELKDVQSLALSVV
jgi:hypothetical protein